MVGNSLFASAIGDGEPGVGVSLGVGGNIDIGGSTCDATGVCAGAKRGFAVGATLKGSTIDAGGGMAVVERAGPWWERSLLRVRAAGPFSERSLWPGPGPFFELSLRLGGDMRLERRLRPGGDMASVLASGGPAWTLAAVLGGGSWAAERVMLGASPALPTPQATLSS